MAWRVKNKNETSAEEEDHPAPERDSAAAGKDKPEEKQGGAPKADAGRGGMRLRFGRH